MERELHRRAGEIFLALDALEAGQREVFVVRACAGNEALRRAVERLRAGDRAQGPMDEPMPARLTELPELASHPDSIQGFRLLGLLGEGGSSRVYAAEQEHPRRRVAIKVLRASIATPSAQRRFAHEIELLGTLNHANIATVFEAGVLPGSFGGIPWFALEIVEGEGLLAHAARAGLDRRARIELYCRILDAVDYAHRQGVVHRDLSPANLRVRADGTPKVLDFGVACLAGEGADAHTRHTRQGDLVGTLHYMSPEQAAGEALKVEATSDVYSLGVVLFELLSGRSPYAARAGDALELLRAIREEEPLPLGRLDPSLRGDLATIVAHALEKARDARYPSAAALAADLRAWLADRPISVRRPSTLYALSKLARRHRTAFASLVLTLGTLAVATVLTTLFALESRRSEALAQDEARRAQRAAYRQGLSSAALAAEHGQVALARRLLDETQEDQRGTEWRLLDARTLRAESTPFVDAGRPGWVWYTPDGELMTLEIGGTLRFFREGAEQQERRRELGPLNPLRETALCGHRLAYAPAGAGEVHTLDLRDGSALAPPLDFGEPVSPFHWSADGARLVVGLDLDASERSRRAAVVDPRTGSVLRTVERDATLVAIDASGHTLLCASPEGVLEWLEIDTGLVRARAEFTGQQPTGVHFLADGQDVLVALREGGVLWVAGEPPHVLRARFEARGPTYALTLSPSGRYLGYLEEGGALVVRTLGDGARILEEPQLGGRFSPPCFSPDERSVVTCELFGRTLRRFMLGARATTTRLAGHTSFVYAARFAGDEDLVLSAAWDMTLRRWNARTGEALGVLELPRQPERMQALYSLALAPSRPWAAAGSLGGRVHVVDYASGAAVAEFTAPGDQVYGLAFAPNGERLWVLSHQYGGAAGSMLSCYPFGITAEEFQLSTAGGSCRPCLAVLPDGELVTAIDRTLALRSGSDGTERLTLQAPSTVTGLAVSRDGRWLASGDIDHEVRLYDARDLTLRQRFLGHSGVVYALAFSPDGRLLASGAHDTTIHLWDIERGEALYPWKAHTDYVYDLAFSADGSLLVSASGDGDVRVWDTRPEEERLRARAARQELRTEALRRLDVPPGDLTSHLRALEEADGLAPDERAAAREALWMQGSKP